MPLSSEITKIQLDGTWKLEELSETIKDYIQLYGFAYSLLPDLPAARRQEVDYIYGKFPWRGGFSTVNFFSQLFHQIPPKLRPEVERIRYASPGYIELAEIVAVAVSVAAIVKSVCASIDIAHETYRKIQKACAEKKLSEIDLSNKELELTQRQLAFCESASKELQGIFNLPEGQIEELERKTDKNPAVKMKVLLSVYRRVRLLAEKQAEGKLTITGKLSDEP